MKYKPKEGDKFWYISLGVFYVFNITYDISVGSHRKIVNFGNCFRTKKEAQTKLKQIKKLLRGVE